eukprot:gene1777-546_t
MQYQLRKSDERGHADHGWLKTYHTFSFAFYYDPSFEEFGCLRVINEDRVTAGKGFGAHSHRSYNIFSYIVEGELTHQDSMGNKETIKPGAVQFTCAGTGITHSEYNFHKSKVCHFIQIWVKPNKDGLKPYYKTMEYTDQQKQGKLCEIVTSDEKSTDSIFMHANARVYSTLLNKNEKVEHKVEKGRKVYVHLIQRDNSSISIDTDVVLKAGDGIFITPKNDETFLTLQGESDSRNEVLLFDVLDE